MSFLEKRLISLGVLLAVIGIFAGCSSRSVNPNDPADLYLDAESEIESDRYLVALDKLRVIKNKFPYSSYSAKAQLRMADVYFLQESFLEAAIAYESFRDLHPKHEQSGYALFRAGLSYLQDAPTNPARDLTSLHRSQDTFEAYLRAYARSTVAGDAERNAEAKAHLTQVKERLAEKEFLIADFYQRTGVPEASRGRLKKVTEIYPDSKFAPEARTRLESLEKQP